MAYTNRIAWEVLRSVDTSTMVASTYLELGTPLLFPSYKLKVVNNSDVLILVSIDGVNDYDVVPPGGFFLYDETQAQISTANAPSIPKGTQVLIQSPDAPGTGSVYLVSQYLIEA